MYLPYKNLIRPETQKYLFRARAGVGPMRPAGHQSQRGAHSQRGARAGVPPGGEQLLKCGALGALLALPHPSLPQLLPGPHPIPTQERTPLLTAHRTPDSCISSHSHLLELFFPQL